LNFILKSESNVKKKIALQNNNSTQDSNTSSNIIARIGFPYISNYSEHIARVCLEFDIVVVHKPINNLALYWGSTKTKLLIHKFQNAVYMIKCLDCLAVYIGESNNVSRRITEHEADVRLKRTTNSALAEHSFKFNHSFNLTTNDITIITNDNYYLTRKLSESYHIQINNHSVNKHPGSLPSTYLSSDLFRNIL
jgi:hypothetical protein